jgi:hypothetical protein
VLLIFSQLNGEICSGFVTPFAKVDVYADKKVIIASNIRAIFWVFISK